MVKDGRVLGLNQRKKNCACCCVVPFPAHDEIVGFQYIFFWNYTCKLQRLKVQFLHVARFPNRPTRHVPCDGFEDAFDTL